MTPRRLSALCLAAALWSPAQEARAQPEAAAAVPGRSEAGARAIRMLERAEAILESLSAEGAPAAAMFGVLTAPARERLAAGAQEAAELCDAAARELDAAIEALDNDPRAGESDALARERVILAVECRELRLPLARARAAVCAGAIAPDQRSRSALAQAALDALAGLSLTGAAIDVRRDTLAGQGLLLSSRLEEADARFGAALARAAGAPPADAPAPMDVAECMLARTLILGASRGPDTARRALTEAVAAAPFTIGGRAQPLLHLLAADAAYRVESGAAGGASAARVYEGLLTREALRAHWPALRAAVFERLETLRAAGAFSASNAPAIAVLARAESNAADPRTIDEAVVALQRVADDERRAGTGLAPEAMWSLAGALQRRAAIEDRPSAAREHDVAAAIQTLLRLHDEFAATEPGRRAPEAAIALAGALRASRDESAVAARREALRLALRLEPDSPDADARRLELALTLEEGDAERTGLLEAVGEESLERARARLILAVEADRAGKPGRALVLARESRRAGEAAGAGLRPEDLAELAGIEVRSLLGRGRGAEALAAAQSAADAGAIPAGALLEACTALASSVREAEREGDAERLERDAALLARFGAIGAAAAGSDSAARARFVRFEADGLAASGGAARALELYAALADPERPTVDLALARAEALFALGRHEEAFALYRDVGAALDESAPESQERWRAWSRMLQILGAQNADGSRTAAIRVRINRLRAQDPALGGEPHRRRIVEVEGALGP